MIYARVIKKFRYKDDVKEVQIMLTKEEAYELSETLIKANDPQGIDLWEYLRTTE